MSVTEEQTASRIYYPMLRGNDQQRLSEWWKWLKDNKGERARLRRCDNPEMVFPQYAFHRLCRQLPWWEKKDVPSVATVAGLLAHVDETASTSFAAQMGEAQEGGDKPRLSELRFQQLMASKDHGELFDRMRRAIHLLGRTANILSVADGVFHWAKDQTESFSDQPSKRFHYAWARDYFNELFKYQ